MNFFPYLVLIVRVDRLVMARFLIVLVFST